MASSSWNSETSSSKKERFQSVPLLNGRGKRSSVTCEGKAENEQTLVGVESNSEYPAENLDGLTEVELDELLKEAWDINQRLKVFERRCNSLQSENISEHESGVKSKTERSRFLPYLVPTKTSLVTGVSLAKATEQGSNGMHKSGVVK